MKRPDTERGIRWWEYGWYAMTTVFLLIVGLFLFAGERIARLVSSAARSVRR